MGTDQLLWMKSCTWNFKVGETELHERVSVIFFPSLLISVNLVLEKLFFMQHAYSVFCGYIVTDICL